MNPVKWYLRRAHIELKLNDILWAWAVLLAQAGMFLWDALNTSLWRTHLGKIVHSNDPDIPSGT